MTNTLVSEVENLSICHWSRGNLTGLQKNIHKKHSEPNRNHIKFSLNGFKCQENGVLNVTIFAVDFDSTEDEMFQLIDTIRVPVKANQMMTDTFIVLRTMDKSMPESYNLMAFVNFATGSVAKQDVFKSSKEMKQFLHSLVDGAKSNRQAPFISTYDECYWSLLDLKRSAHLDVAEDRQKVIDRAKAELERRAEAMQAALARKKKGQWIYLFLFSAQVLKLCLQMTSWRFNLNP
jgi:hypothetical protein